jgi:uncharacterized membrane protein YoaK (UPF0700 family)
MEIRLGAGVLCKGDGLPCNDVPQEVRVTPMLEFATLVVLFIAAAIIAPALTSAPTALVLMVVASVCLFVLYLFVAAAEEGDN